MEHQIVIRQETAADISAIAEITAAAFKTLGISNQTEQFIVAALRAAKALIVSLVAELNGRVVGHVAFSRVTISDGTQNWYGLGPVSVLPEYQRQGIGKALIRQGLSILKGLNAGGCCLVGIQNIINGSDSETFMGLSMREFRKRSFLPCLWTGMFRRESLCFTTGSKRMGNKRGQAALCSAFDPPLTETLRIGVKATHYSSFSRGE